MPTGYTCIIEDSAATFEQYAWRCARAFFALITLRDDPLDTLIPDEMKPSAYYAVRVAEARSKLERLNTMTVEEAERAAQEEYEGRVVDYRESVARGILLAQRYSAMRERVESWEPPTPEHEGLKQFMLDQIDLGAKRFGLRSEVPAPESGRAWMEGRRRELMEDIERNEQGQREEEELTRRRREWIVALRKSLKP